MTNIVEATIVSSPAVCGKPQELVREWLGRYWNPGLHLYRAVDRAVDLRSHLISVETERTRW